MNELGTIKPYYSNLALSCTWDDTKLKQITLRRLYWDVLSSDTVDKFICTSAHCPA